LTDVPAVEELGLLATGAMRARRHPRAIAGLWAWETVLALIASASAVSLVGATWGNGPGGDAVLWTPGGRPLIDLLFRQAAGVHAATTAAIVVLVVGAVAGLVPMAALLTTLAYATRDKRSAGFVRAMGEGLRVFPSMALLLVVAAVAQALVAGFGLAAGSVVEAWAHAGMGEARAQQLEGLVLLLFAAVFAAIGVAHDLSRAAVVRFRVGGWRGLLLGARTFRLAPAVTMWSWAWRALASLAPLVAVAWLTGRLGGRSGAALLAVFVLHQAVIGARVALRASWLARAMRAVDHTLNRGA
jgi:hypothetical protein